MARKKPLIEYWFTPSPWGGRASQVQVFENGRVKSGEKVKQLAKDDLAELVKVLRETNLAGLEANLPSHHPRDNDEIKLVINLDGRSYKLWWYFRFEGGVEKLESVINKIERLMKEKE